MKLINTWVAPAVRRELVLFLELLRWRAGTLLFCGREALRGPFSLPVPFIAMSRADRLAVAKTWLEGDAGPGFLVGSGGRWLGFAGDPGTCIGGDIHGFWVRVSHAR